MEFKWRFARWTKVLIALLSVPSFLAGASRMANAEAQPKPEHVFIIVLENEGYDVTFGADSPALYLNALARKGALLKNYYGIGHFSLDNYIAMISGQAPNPATQADCQKYVEFGPTDAQGNAKLNEYGQAIGEGCVYPRNVPTLVNQLEAKGLSWKGYMEDMGNDPRRDNGKVCAHPKFDNENREPTQRAARDDQYATRHNPFMYFHSIIDDAANCDAHVVNLSALTADLKSVVTTPNYAYITPNLCHDGHDKPCVNGEPGGLISADKFLSKFVPKILNSPAYKRDGLLIITFDEAGSNDVGRCCNEQNGPNINPKTSTIDFSAIDKIPDQGPGIFAVDSGGGRVGAVLVSRYIKEGTVSSAGYNHYSLLRSVEDFFDLRHLGYAGQKGLGSFGDDVFTQPGGRKD